MDGWSWSDAAHRGRWKWALLGITVCGMFGHLEIAKQGSGHGERLSADKGGCYGQRQIMQAAEG